MGRSKRAPPVLLWKSGGNPPTHSSRVLPPPRPPAPGSVPLLPACPLLAGALFLASPPGPRCSPSLFRTLLQKELSPFFVMDPRRKQGLLAWTLTQLGCFTLLMVGEKPQSCAKLQSPSPPLPSKSVASSHPLCQACEDYTASSVLTFFSPMPPAWTPRCHLLRRPVPAHALHTYYATCCFTRPLPHQICGFSTPCSCWICRCV